MIGRMSYQRSRTQHDTRRLSRTLGRYVVRREGYPSSDATRALAEVTRPAKRTETRAVLQHGATVLTDCNVVVKQQRIETRRHIQQTQTFAGVARSP